MDYIIYYAISGFVFGFVCNAILKDKGYGTDENPNYGFWWGFFLGVLGLVVCCCKQRLEKDIDNKEKNEAKQKVEDDYWICPQCSSRINICFSECSCGYKNEIEEKKTWECPICGTNNLEDNKECQCGYRIDIKEETWECPKCHSTNPIEFDKCICGYHI